MKRGEPPTQADAERAPDAAHLAQVRPPDWPTPTPNGRYHLVVVGGGPAGLVAARFAAMLGAKVALVERQWLGGESLNWGSVPSKTFLRTARFYAEMRQAAMFGATQQPPPAIDVGAAMERARRVRERIGQASSAHRLRALGIDVYFGAARFTGADAVDAGGVTLRFKKALIATGSRPKPVDIPGLAEAGYMEPSAALNLQALPQRVLVIGGGPNGCEGA